ncbi:hypothetical protein OOZ19_10265 [Saccharopolyspora sp. NFXS83]|uniref:hypothetical protein n=1 Tax=Saccharopolyspora sp. NFXS83 TaxID=2993560 RepID=UPI00224AE818|nr:hypothetical protein [Saccharopolyspora sp. NFXS83]MCX2730626.1 hypothetical protein [Saccharopolyspora sp. NFXS83]
MITNWGERMKRRLGAALGVLVSAAAIPFVTALPAQATAEDCKTYLSGAGYVIGAGVENACNMGSGPFPKPEFCITQLQSLQVTPEHAGAACELARR